MPSNSATGYRDLDREFYNQLDHYSPCCCYSGGRPMFLIHKQCHKSFICISISCLVYASLIFLSRNFHFFKDSQEKDSSTLNNILTVMNVVILVVMVCSFLLTQFLNPGIDNPDTIPDRLKQQIGVKYCTYCSATVLDSMWHCKFCKVCVRNKDHHCSFFQKCMGGKLQRYSFVVFIISASAAFFSLFISLILYLF